MLRSSTGFGETTKISYFTCMGVALSRLKAESFVCNATKDL
jgi:hypothetical protein